MIIDFILSIFFTALVLMMGWHILNLIDPKKKVIETVIALTLVVLLSVGTFWSLATYRGYPSADIHEKEYHLVWGDVRQPKENDPGAIYLWLYEPKREPNWLEELIHVEFKSIPRAYVLPYSKKLEDELRKALQKIREGGGANVGFEKQKSPKKASNDQNYQDLVPKFSTIDPHQTLEKN